MVENTFSVPVVVHSLELPADAHQVFQLGKFKAKVSDVYLFKIRSDYFRRVKQV